MRQRVELQHYRYETYVSSQAKARSKGTLNVEADRVEAAPTRTLRDRFLTCMIAKMVIIRKVCTSNGWGSVHAPSCDPMQ